MACLHIPVGEMSKRITIQAISQASDGQGGFADSWATYLQSWAKMEQLSQREAYYAQQMESPAQYRFTMRYRAGITTKHRILYGSRTFNITRVNNINEEDALIELLATEGVAT